MVQLYTKLSNAGLIDEMGNIVLERYGNGSYQSVDKVTFETFFSDVSTNPTYEALSGSHTFVWNGETLTRTAEELGYKKYFDQWKAQGIL